ncbi:hypothetical protein CIK94_05200 [Prevotella sp. P4-51]|nr:hypothetical protein CIK94_05200 [Prevotella sp. P4-51]
MAIANRIQKDLWLFRAVPLAVVGGDKYLREQVLRDLLPLTAAPAWRQRVNPSASLGNSPRHL